LGKPHGTVLELEPALLLRILFTGFEVFYLDKKNPA
jgi:hypothetical protein